MKKNLVIWLFVLVTILAVAFFLLKPVANHKSSAEKDVVATATPAPNAPSTVMTTAVGTPADAPPTVAQINNDPTKSANITTAPAISSNAAPIILAANPPSPMPSNSKAEEIAARFADAKTPADLLKNADLSDPEVRAYVVARMSEMQDEKRESVLAKAERLGIPTRIDGPGHTVSLIYDFRGDVPLYRKTKNLNAAISTGANLLRDGSAPYALDGTGMKVAVWDEAKIKNTHQEFPNSRVTIKDGTTTFSDHSTHVAGTIGANGTVASAKGMAPKVSIDSYDWTSDYTEMTAAGAATATEVGKIPISNHSYGAGFDTAAEYVPYMGRYEDEANTTDALAASLPYYLIFWAAGNEQDYLITLGGYQSITFNGLAKNILTVGAANDAVTSGFRDISKGTIASFSSEGPCDDGRIKPDIVANGVGVYSSVAFVPPDGTVASTNSYDTYDGTSMATPNAVGSSILLEQLYGREFSGQRLRASMLKALLIETADDRGRPGPDYQYGWGYMNVKAAADLILAHKASLASPKMIEDQLTNSVKTKTHTFQWDGSTPIRATLCWTDPAGAIQANDSRTPNLVHNLDLKITAPDGTTISRPYIMPFVGTWTQASMTLNATTGINNTDNVEQVYIATPSQAGTYTLTVSVTANLTTASQAYSLVVMGGSSVASNPPPTVTLTAPANGTVLLPNVATTLTATATDTNISGGAGTVSSVQFFYGTTSIGTDTTAPYSTSWTPPASGAYVLTAVATDSEGASATSSAINITVLSGDGAPTIASFSPTSGIAGNIITITGTNFAAVSAVKFNGVDASFTVVSPTSITATVPATAATGVITVTTTYGTATSTSAFTITQNPVLISQIYGAGGNTGATYNADYIELYNRSAAPVSVAGWSVQYASASGTAWTAVALTGSIAPGKYYLVKLAGGTNGAALPTADATGSISMSGSSGKVALRNTATAFTTASNPTGQTGLQDLVGFGTANAYETLAAPSPSATSAIFRAGSGATDTGNNSVDFSTSTPNPRNSSSGSVTAPVISSATTASGVVSQAFSYQLSASNSPTSFAATGLPANLSINTSTGLISGTPAAAGTSTVTLSATNAAGTGNATLTITVTTSGGGGAVTIFSENMGTATTGTAAISANTFQNSGSLTFSGTGDVRTTQTSSGYANVSGGRNVFITNTTDTNFIISGINTVGYTGLSLSFGHYNNVNAASNELAVEVSSDGTTYSPLTYSRTIGATSWQKITPTGSIPSTANLRIRFRQTVSTASYQFRVDDVSLTGTAAASPVINSTGTLTAVNTTYGTASPTPTTFSVSGANMTAGILVTPPAGFEVSQTAGGASGYATTQTIGASGTINATTVYLRLAANTSADSYAGNVVCSSTGAASVNVVVATSSVARKILNITAQNRTKPFGTSLTLGTSAFTPTGLVLSETIGSVALAASGGTATYDAVGAYSITAANATGGTFTAGNYDISYQTGTLTVTAPTFAEWSTGLANATASGDSDKDGISNLLEYYMGLNPLAADAVATIVTISSSEIHFDYRRSKALNGTSGQVEWISDLTNTNWSTTGITDTLLNDQGAYENRRAILPLQVGDTKKFLHLHVTTP